MDTATLLRVIVSAAHEAWRARMMKAGWLPGPRYDAAQRTHPALCPYDALPAYRRWQLSLVLNSECDPEVLVDAVDSLLGEPEWTTADVHVGMPVYLAGDLQPGTIGTVVSWEVADEDSGAITDIRVRWPDGEEIEYVAAAHELYKVAEG